MQSEEDPDDGERLDPLGGVFEIPSRLVTRGRRVMQRSHRELHDPEQDQRSDHREEQVRRRGEDPSRLLDAAQVADSDQRDEEQTHGHAELMQRRDRGDDGGDARRHRDRHGEHVVRQQRDPRDLRRHQTEVVLRDDVRASRGRVGLDRLAVAEHQDRQHPDDHERERHDQRERGRRHRAGDEQRPQHLLGGIGDGGERVRREDGQRRGPAEPLVDQVGGRDRRAEEQPLEGVRAGMRQRAGRLPSRRLLGSRAVRHRCS